MGGLFEGRGAPTQYHLAGLWEPAHAEGGRLLFGLRRDCAPESCRRRWWMDMRLTAGHSEGRGCPRVRGGGQTSSGAPLRRAGRPWSRGTERCGGGGRGGAMRRLGSAVWRPVGCGGLKLHQDAAPAERQKDQKNMPSFFFLFSPPRCAWAVPRQKCRWSPLV